MVDELLVGEGGLRVVIAPAEQGVARQSLEIPPVLLDVLAVVALRSRQAEHALLQDRVAAVPEREREAQLVADVGDPGHSVLVPAVRARAGVVVGEEAPGVAARRVVLPDGAPGALAQVRPPLVPRARGEQVVLRPTGGLGEPRVLGGRRSLRHPGCPAVGESMRDRSKRCQFQGGSATYIPSRRSSPARSKRCPSAASSRRHVAPRRSSHGSETWPYGRLVAEVDDHELAREVAPPAPADELPPRLVAVPASPPGACPRAHADHVVSQEREQQLVERPELVVDRLVGPSAEKDGQVHLPALELALVDEPRPRLAQRRDGGRAGLGRGEGRRGPGLVVVLDEADEPPLVVEVRGEVPEHARRLPRARGGRRAACRSSSRSPAAGASTPDPSTPPRRTRSRGDRP